VRGAFIKAITELAERDSRVMLLTADLGFMVFEPFAEKFPQQFLNVGVAEQNMIGMATGLAEAGFIPFVYSIVTFASLRGYEFIRNGPILHHLPVRIIGVGGGFEYGTAGPTHHGLEDVGVMRIQPGLTVIAPADAAQTHTAIHVTYDLPGPIYYRLGKNDKIVVPGLDGAFELGAVHVIREGSDLLLLAMGGITSEVTAAAETLAAQGIACTVAVVSTINPVPTEPLVRLLSRFPLALTVEAHYISGGLGSLVAEVIAENGLNCRLTRCGVRAAPNGLSGSQRFLEQANGLSSGAIAQTALQVTAAVSRDSV
jgi:transketolase